MDAEAKTAKLLEVVKKLEDIDGITVCKLIDFLDGTLSITKKGILRLPIAMKAAEVLESDDLRNVLNGGWKSYPVLVMVDFTDTDEEPPAQTG